AFQGRVERPREETLAQLRSAQWGAVKRHDRRDGPMDELVASLALDGLGGTPFGTVLADPPWRFTNRTGKVGPEHRRLSRYDTMTWKQISAMPVADLVASQSHCYLWVPNALVAEGLQVLESWGFCYKTMLVWHKIRRDGGSDGRGVGFYFRNVT